MKKKVIRLFSILAVMLGFLLADIQPTDHSFVAYAMSQSDYDSKVNSFINDYRWSHGTGWDYYKKPEIAWNGIGCCSYVNDFVRYVYGADSQKSGTKYTGVDNIKTGDVLYINSSKYGEHWIAILARNGNNLYVAEGNASSKVRITSSEWTISGSGLYNSWSAASYSLQYGYHYDEITPDVVIPEVIWPTSVSLNKTAISFSKIGETETLYATIEPSNATDQVVVWLSMNESVATVNEYGVVTAVGYGTTTVGVMTNSGGCTAVCEVTVNDPEMSEDGWYYTSVLPSDITSEEYEIEYAYIEEMYATADPGEPWTDTGVMYKEYVKVGDAYSTISPIATSDTVQYVGCFYYHWCGPGTGSSANFEATSKYVHYDQISNANDVYEYSSAIDKDDNRYTYYHLKWLDGSDAYCNSYTTCDGANGTHGNRSFYWYKVWYYQNYEALEWRLYTNFSGWVKEKDDIPVVTDYRYKLREDEDVILPAVNPFVDVAESQYYYQPVLWALENNITAGLTPTSFAPEAACTRGQVVTFLWRAMGCPKPSNASNPFVDVYSDAYYYEAVLWALENGITAGVDSTHFDPDATVTRGQFVTFLHRVENTPSYSVSNPFIDVPNTYYYDAVLWAYENEVTAGTDAEHFSPDAPCTRGQVVTFLYRALNK